MWQIHWAISLIPDSVLILIYYAFIYAGLIGYIGSKFFKRFPFKYIPFLGQYPLLSEVLGITMLSLGLFLYGGYATEMVWREKVAEAEAKVAEAEAKSAVVNTVIKTKIVKEQQIVRDTQVVVQQQIKEVEKLIDAECKLDPIVSKILNKAAKNPLTLEDNK